MKARYFILILMLLLSGILPAQQIQFPASTSRTSENAKYWKNRLPRQDYWQQDVHYHIEASLNVEENMMEGTFYKLVYYNNSPHFLNHLFFNLYDNAFTPGSHYHSLVNSNHAEPVFGKNEKAGKAMQVYDLQVDGQVPAKQELDYSLLKVTLSKPLKPGDSLVVTCKFKTWWSDGGSLRRRNKSFDTFGYLHVNGTHWYPTIAVFDAHGSWNVDQHLDKEYYTNFGTYDVALTFPNDYVVEATGVLLNESEMLPDTLKEKLDITNFKSKPFGEKPSMVTKRVPGANKTWIFRAENVHNFAFTGNPTYRIGTSFWNGIKVVTLAQEPHASRWQPSAAFAASVIRVYSETFGQYEWPKIVVADAGDGMEYPMLTLCGGTFPGHQELLAHEIGHQWFYGMLGSNETYRAWMDEGFTQYLTIEAAEQLLPSQAFRDYPKMTVPRYFGLYFPYLSAVRNGWDHKLNTHSSDFNGAVGQKGGYSLVYTKTGTMLHQLKYVLGDAMFSEAMKYYVAKWKFCHPYPEDFKQAIVEFAQQDLNWFFDQWLETKKQIDYGIETVTQKGGYNYEVKLKRFEDMEMPLDIRVTDIAGKTYDFHIPNRYINNRSFTSQELPNWYGWGAYIKPTYNFSLELGAKLKSLEVDPEGLLSDVNRVNNFWQTGLIKRKLNTEFGLNTNTYPLWFYPNLKFAPKLWYNGMDGFQVGFQWAANYFDQTDLTSGGLWVNSGFPQMNGEANWKSHFQLWGGEAAFRIRGIGKGQFITPSILWDAGLFRGKLGWEKEFRKRDQNNPRFWRLRMGAVWMSRSSYGYFYLLKNDPFETWSSTTWGGFGSNFRRAWNNFVNAELFRQYPIKQGVGYLTFSVRLPGIGSDFNYSWAQIESKHLRNIGKTQLRFRTFARLGLGNTPFESQLRLSGAPREAWIDNQFTRARGLFPGEWGSSSWNIQQNLHVAGGLGLRGMFNNRLYNVGYANGNQLVFNTSNSGLSTNLEYDFAKWIGLKPGKRLSWQVYAFADAALVFDKPLGPERFSYWTFADAGLGANVEIKTTSFMRKPIVLRLDMPFWANEDWGNQSNLRPRWVLGFDKSF